MRSYFLESAIRKKNECLNYLRLASRVDAVASRVKTAQSMKRVTKEIGTTSKALEGAMKSMNLEKITAIMDKFEGQFENLDVQTAVMENSMGDAMSTQTPSSQVDDLINQVNTVITYNFISKPFLLLKPEFVVKDKMFPIFSLKKRV